MVKTAIAHPNPILMKLIPLTLFTLILILTSSNATAFCGFYVAKADASLYNQASQVIIARTWLRTTITMANDYKGDPSEFALVVPVPKVIKEHDVKVLDQAIVDHVDAYSAPRLTEYFDDNPCRVIQKEVIIEEVAGPGGRADGPRALGVKVESEFSVGEYDIVVLSAKESDGLQTWLEQNGYRIPEGAGPVLGSYIKQGTKFFVAKVNLKRQAATGFTYLRPLQVTFTTLKFKLPIRLGTVNASGPQDLLIYVITKKGRVETTNYRTVKLPTGQHLPLFVRDNFAEFYRAMFDEAVRLEKMETVFTEYAWDLGWCDPCASDPLTNGELRKLGAHWVRGEEEGRPEEGRAFITRLHLRYDREHFPEDLVFQETRDTKNYQGRYVLTHPWKGEPECESAREYLRRQPEEREKENKTLARLTGWSLKSIRRRAAGYVDRATPPER